MVVKEFNIDEAAKQYQSAQPFPNIVFNDLVDTDLLNSVVDEFPDLENADPNTRVKYWNPLEMKHITSGPTNIGPRTQALIDYLNGPEWLAKLQVITGIPEPLIADHKLMGGGLHSSPKGGLLKLHIDFNKHYETGYDRRVNLLLYLNKDWHEDWGGNIELWEHGFDENGEITAEQRMVSELPTFNKMVIFNTTETSLHGHPDPNQCPDNRKRMSLALYYYTNGRSDIEEGQKHNSVWAARNHPNDINVNELKK
jgi:hypothetical protein